jgi:hypothetical protein
MNRACYFLANLVILLTPFRFIRHCLALIGGNIQMSLKVGDCFALASVSFILKCIIACVALITRF